MLEVQSPLKPRCYAWHTLNVLTNDTKTRSIFGIMGLAKCGLSKSNSPTETRKKLCRTMSGSKNVLHMVPVKGTGDLLLLLRKLQDTWTICSSEVAEKWLPIWYSPPTSSESLARTKYQRASSCPPLSTAVEVCIHDFVVVYAAE